MKEKKYKNISEVSELLDIKTHVIRYWDSKFEGISIRLNSNKQRFFNSDNIKRINDLKNTLYLNGKQNYSLDLAKKIIDKKEKHHIPENRFSSNSNAFNISKLIKVKNDLTKLIDI